MVGRIKRRMGPLLYVQSFWVLVIIVLISVLFTLITPQGTFLSLFNLKSLLIDGASLVILTVGATFVLIAAGIDLSVGSVLVLTTVVTLKLVLALQSAIGVGPALLSGVLFAVVFGTIMGIINGFLITKLRIPSFVATLGTMGAALGLARLVSGGTNVPGVPRELMSFIGRAPFGIPMPVIIAVVVVAIGAVVLGKTKFGRYTYAIGSNVESARRVGIRVDRQAIAIYALMGTIAGVVAIMDLGRFGVASINAHTTSSLQAIAGAVIGGASLFGGRGTIFGAVLGAMIPALLRNGFIILGLEPYWQEVAVGVVLLAAVYFDQWRRRKLIAVQARRARFDDETGPITVEDAVEG